MSMSISGQMISKLKIVDDNAIVRDSLAETVKDMNISPDVIVDPLGSLENFLKTQTDDTDAFIFDHQLKQSGYALFNGAEAVASLYKKRPSVLYSAWIYADADTIRFHRRHIPSIIHSIDEIDPDRIAREIEVCLNEFKDEYLPSREPIKTRVRIESVDREKTPAVVYAVIPSWNPKEVIRFPLSMVPPSIRSNINEGVRLWAQVNLGAEDHSGLVLDSFEFRG